MTKLTVELDPDEQIFRSIYAFPRALTWIETVLDGLQTDGHHHGALSPADQFENLLYEYIKGGTDFDLPPHTMRPNPETDGIWEICSHDLRLFGWFWKNSQFILSAVDTAQRCHSIQGLHRGYRDQTIYDRDHLDLDEPKFISGSDLANVF
ncbi:MAG: hypothetical protein ABI230_06955 [Aestuariivirga sp.]